MPTIDINNDDYKSILSELNAIQMSQQIDNSDKDRLIKILTEFLNKLDSANAALYAQAFIVYLCEKFVIDNHSPMKARLIQLRQFLISAVLNQRNIFGDPAQKQVHFFDDPDLGKTVLISLCKLGYEVGVKDTLNQLEIACECAFKYPIGVQLFRPDKWLTEMKGNKTINYRKYFLEKDKENVTALQIAYENNHQEILRFLMDKASLMYSENPSEGFKQFTTQHDHTYNNLLLSACMNGHQEKVQLLLDIALNVHGGLTSKGFKELISMQSGDERNSLLISACKNGHEKLVQLLLDIASSAYGGLSTEGFKRFISLENNDKFTVLTFACIRGYLSIVELLIEKAAVAYGKYDSVEFKEFLQHLNKGGLSPFHSACRAGERDVIRLLISTAEKSFKSPQSPEFIKFIQQPCAYQFSPLNAACKEEAKTDIQRCGLKNVVSLLLHVAEQIFGKQENVAYQAFLQTPNKLLNTPLNSACRRGDVDIATMLLTYAKDAFGRINSDGFRQFLISANDQGYTPFLSACSAGHDEVAKLLFEHALQACNGNQEDEWFNKFIYPINSKGESIDVIMKRVMNRPGEKGNISNYNKICRLLIKPKQSNEVVAAAYRTTETPADGCSIRLK